MADNSGMDMSYILNVLQGILDSKTQVDPVSQMFYNDLLDNFDAVVGTLKDANKINKTELNKIAEYVKKTLSSNYGVQYTQQFKDLIAEFKEAIKVSIGKKESVDATKVVAGFSNIISTAISQSLMAEKRGDKKGALLKNTTEANAKVLAEEVVKKLGLEGMLDKGIDKVLTFLGATNKDNQKKQKGLLDDLVDALGKGRLGKIGQDIFRVVGFMGARWLSQFGQFGKIMGGLFYVAMESFAPILAQLIVTGLGKLITWGVGSICNAIWNSKLIQGMGKGLLNYTQIGVSKLSGNKISPAFEAMQATTGAEKAVGIAKVGGLGLVGAGALAGAGWAAGETVDSWKQGKKGNAAALGVGAGLLGAGGLAAIGAIFIPALTAAFFPYIVPIITIGATVTGLAKWWKAAHQEDKEKDKEEKSFWQSFVDWIKSLKIFGGGGSENNNNNQLTTFPGGNVPTGIQTYNTGSRGSTAQLLSGKTDIRGHLDPRKMTEEDWKRADNLDPIYGKMGEIVNLGQMSRKRAMEVVKADIVKKGDKSFYEALTADVADLGSFGTDIPFAAKGTMDRFKALKAQMIKEGVAGAENAKISSSIGTLGSRQQMSPHSYTDSIYGHFGSNATTIDIINSATRKGYNISNAQAKRYGIAYVNREGDHDHVSFGWLNRQIESQGGQKAESVKHSITSKALIESSALGGAGEFYKWLFKKYAGTSDTFSKLSQEDQNKIMNQYLKELGVRPVKDTEGKEHWYAYEKGLVPGTSKKTGMEAVLDPSGNVTFEKVKLNMQAATNKGLNN